MCSLPWEPQLNSFNSIRDPGCFFSEFFCISGMPGDLPNSSCVLPMADSPDNYAFGRSKGGCSLACIDSPTIQLQHVQCYIAVKSVKGLCRKRSQASLICRVLASWQLREGPPGASRWPLFGWAARCSNISRFWRSFQGLGRRIWSSAVGLQATERKQPSSQQAHFTDHSSNKRCGHHFVIQLYPCIP